MQAVQDSAAPLDVGPPAEASRPLLEQVAKGLGFVPNLYAAVGASPALLGGVLALQQAFSGSSFTPTQREVVLLAASVENGCAYCQAAHSMLLTQVLRVPSSVVDAIRAGGPLEDESLAALVAITREVVASRGHPGQAALARFRAAGFRDAQLLDVLLGIAIKTISNYTHHMTRVPIDAALAAA